MGRKDPVVFLIGFVAVPAMVRIGSTRLKSLRFATNPIPLMCGDLPLFVLGKMVVLGAIRFTNISSSTKLEMEPVN